MSEEKGKTDANYELITTQNAVVTNLKALSPHLSRLRGENWEESQSR